MQDRIEVKIFFFLESTANLEREVGNLRMLSSEDLFFVFFLLENAINLGQKVEI